MDLEGIDQICRECATDLNNMTGEEYEYQWGLCKDCYDATIYTALL